GLTPCASDSELIHGEGVVRHPYVFRLRAQGEGRTRRTDPNAQQAGTLRRGSGAGGEGRRARQRSQEDVVAQVLPRLHSREYGAQRRDVARGEIDPKGYWLCRRRHPPRTDL